MDEQEAYFVHVIHFSSMFVGLFSGRCLISPSTPQKVAHWVSLYAMCNFSIFCHRPALGMLWPMNECPILKRSRADRLI